MAFKGTSGKSSSGASMSRSDVEVEARLQALEKGLAECKAACESHSHGGVDQDTLHQLKKNIFESRKGVDAADTYKLNDRLESLNSQLKKQLNGFTGV